MREQEKCVSLSQPSLEVAAAPRPLAQANEQARSFFRARRAPRPRSLLFAVLRAARARVYWYCACAYIGTYASLSLSLSFSLYIHVLRGRSQAERLCSAHKSLLYVILEKLFELPPPALGRLARRPTGVFNTKEGQLSCLSCWW